MKRRLSESRIARWMSAVVWRTSAGMQWFVLALIAVAGCAACSGGPTVPSRLPAPPSSSSPPPSPPAPPASEPVLTGELTVTSMSPPPEGHLAVWDCDPTLTMSLVRPAHQIGMCSDGFRASVDVLVPRDISSGMVEILFRDASGSLCAYASSGRSALQAGVRTRFETTSLDLSDHPAIPLLCAPLPFTTTTMAVVLEGTYTGPRLTQEFSHAFAFVAK